jgi:hypothetical protein
MTQISKLALPATSILFILLIVSPVFAQKLSNQTKIELNITNASAAAGGSAAAAAPIILAIKALETGDKGTASSYLAAAQRAFGESDQAKNQFNEAMKSFSSGDLIGALKHLKVALNFLS